MKKILLIFSVLVLFTTNAQVGIGTTTPKANLDISASNPSAPITTDGLLIPRVTAFPSPVTANQNGMLVFLTNAFGTNQEGLYYYDFPSTTWKWIASGTNSNVWINNNANSRIEVPKLSDGITPRPIGNEVVISDSGNVGIGTTVPVSKLEINDTSGTLRELRVVSEGINNHYPNIDIVRYTGASSFLGHPVYSQSLAGGTAISPLVAPANRTVAANIGYGYSNGSFKEIGRLNFGTSSTFSNSDTSANFNLFLNNGTSGLARFTILSNGFTGIDNTTPTEKLDINGNLKFSGAIMPNNLAGTTGDILSSAGAGIAPIWKSTSSLLSNEWHLTGNSSTTPGTNFIGTTDAKDFITKTNGLERMRIASNGNVGIGTTNPQAKLHVTNGSDGEMLLEGTNKGRLLAFSGGGFWIESGTSYTSGSVDDIVFSGMLGWPEWMRIKSTGNIGIGTSAPTEKLDVSGNIKLSGAFKPNNFAGTIGEILTSAGAGAAPTWSSKTVKPYITTGVATGIYTVSLSEYTIRVFGTISEIRLPNAVGNLGKTYIIIGSNGITSKIFSTAGGVIYDDVTNVFISTITSGQRYMVQSDGSDWIVIGR